MFSRIVKGMIAFGPLTKVRKALSFARHELTDIYGSYLSRGRASRLTPYGFSLAGGGSQHHLAMQRGDFEREETELFTSILGETETFVDVGANVGFYSCLARVKGCRVLAIEPLEKNLAHLFLNLTCNGWRDVEVFPVGLSDKPGIATLYGASSTGASLIGSWAGASQAFRRTIALSTLDILLSDRFPTDRLFIKIDVEGSEYATLLGASRTLRRVPRPTWVIEICLNEYHPNGMNPHFEDIFKLFWSEGYQASTADSRNRPVLPADVADWMRNGRSESGTINYKFSQKNDAI